MPTAVNWITGEITIDRADMPIVQASPEVRSLDVEAFRLDLKDLEAAEFGMPWPDTHRNQTPAILSGVQYARIVEIISPYFVTFEDGQYAVALTGANNNIVDVKTQNQVSVIANNSAGLINLPQVNDIFGQVQREVWIDTTALVNGDSGYQQAPFNNITDAIDYAEANNLRALVFLADATIDRQLKNFQVRGIGLPVINMNNLDLDGCQFANLQLDGTLGAGTIRATDCVLRNNVSGLRGDFLLCEFGGDVVTATAATTSFIQCFSGLGGANQRPTLSAPGAVDVSIRGWRGGLTLLNINSALANVTVEADQCKVTLDATCTNGDISVRGQFQLSDQSTGAVVDLTSHVDPIVMKNSLSATLGLYGK